MWALAIFATQIWPLDWIRKKSLILLQLGIVKSELHGEIGEVRNDPILPREVEMVGEFSNGVVGGSIPAVKSSLHFTGKN
jgi:hypothetical protein